jgi:hypothetical protein
MPHTKATTTWGSAEFLRVLVTEVGRSGPMIAFDFSYLVPNPNYGQQTRNKKGKVITDYRRGLERKQRRSFVNTAAADEYAALLSRQLERDIENVDSN